MTRKTAVKVRGVDACANEHGVIAAVAIDQRGLLKRALAATTGRSVAAADLLEFNAIVAEVLSPFASALLLDPHYGLEAVAHHAPDVGVLLAYETSGYHTAVKGRFPDLLPGWSVRRLVAASAGGIKIVMYYDSDEQPSINDSKHAFIERVGAECLAEDVAFFFEPITYADGIDSQSAAYARLKPDMVRQAMAEFSRPEYGVDILKVEIPVNPHYLKGAPGSRDGESVYGHAEAVEHFRAATVAAVARVPFVYLSAGVSDEVFRAMLGLAAEAKVPYSGVLWAARRGSAASTPTPGAVRWPCGCSSKTTACKTSRR